MSASRRASKATSSAWRVAWKGERDGECGLVFSPGRSPPFLSHLTTTIHTHIPGLVGAVAAPCQDLSANLIHQDAADGDFLAEEGGAGLEREESEVENRRDG